MNIANILYKQATLVNNRTALQVLQSSVALILDMVIGTEMRLYKRRLAMKKLQYAGFVFLFVLSISQAISGSRYISDTMTMRDARARYSLAIKKNERDTIGDFHMYKKWSGEIDNIDEKIDFAILWTLGQRGSYEDVVYPGIEEFMLLSAKKIKKEKCGTEGHRVLALEGIDQLLYILTTVNKQRIYGDLSENIETISGVRNEFLKRDIVCRHDDEKSNTREKRGSQSPAFLFWNSEFQIH